MGDVKATVDKPTMDEEGAAEEERSWWDRVSAFADKWSKGDGDAVRELAHLFPPAVKKVMEQELETYQRLFDHLNKEPLDAPVMSTMLIRKLDLQRVNQLNPSRDVPPGCPSGVDVHFIAEATHFLRMADKVYLGTPDEVGIARRDLIIDCLSESAPSCGDDVPRHAVAFDHLTRSLVVIIRGTQTLEDVMVDVVAAPTDALDGRGQSHKGIAKAATQLVEQLMPVLKEQLAEQAGYRLVLTGHSLGAGAAVMMALTLRHQADRWVRELPEGALEKMAVFAYAPPPVWTPLSALSEEDVANVAVFVNNIDVVPRCTLRNFEIMYNRAAHVDKAIKNLSWQTFLSAMMGREDEDEEAKAVLGKVEAALEEAGKEAASDQDHCGHKWLNAQLYHPGRLFHLYPLPQGDGAADSEADEYQRGAVSAVAEAYGIQEVSADALASAQAMEGDAFVHDHFTPPYIAAFQRLAL